MYSARVGKVARLAQFELPGQILGPVELVDLDPGVGEPARVVGADDRGHRQVVLVFPVGSVVAMGSMIWESGIAVGALG